MIVKTNSSWGEEWPNFLPIEVCHDPSIRQDYLLEKLKLLDLQLSIKVDVSCLVLQKLKLWSSIEEVDPTYPQGRLVEIGRGHFCLSKQGTLLALVDRGQC